MIGYRVLRIPLDAADPRKEIVPVGQAVRQVFISDVTDLADVQIAFGQSADWLEATEKSRSFELCPAHTDGIYLQIPSDQVGSVIELVISYGGTVLA